MSATIDKPIAQAEIEDDGCPECLMGNLNWLLTQAHYALASELAAAFEPLGISPRDHAVLGAAMTGGHTQKQLAELVGLDKTTMVATLDELEAAGLARRVPSVTDRRAHVVEVTPEGRKTVAAAGKVTKRVQANVLGALGETVGTEFLDALCTLVRDRLAEPAACKSIRRREPRPSAA
jgi:MarR family transcriptional regulator, transcriptional regulator for hemolysin